VDENPYQSPELTSKPTQHDWRATLLRMVPGAVLWAAIIGAIVYAQWDRTDVAMAAALVAAALQSLACWWVDRPRVT
jgi:uncharacterized membrane protein